MEDDLVVTNQNSSLTNHNGFKISEINACQPTSTNHQILQNWLKGQFTGDSYKFHWDNSMVSRFCLQPIHWMMWCHRLPWWSVLCSQVHVIYTRAKITLQIEKADLLHLCMPYRYYIILYIMSCGQHHGRTWLKDRCYRKMWLFFWATPLLGLNRWHVFRSVGGVRFLTPHVISPWYIYMIIDDKQLCIYLYTDIIYICYTYISYIYNIIYYIYICILCTLCITVMYIYIYITLDHIYLAALQAADRRAKRVSKGVLADAQLAARSMMEVTGPAGNGVISWRSLGDMICIYYIWYIIYIILYILYYIYIIYYIYYIIYIYYILYI